ncbi:hypothetical protein EUBVEN_00454 [Eubacterium ventriosum ATCC 27560]|uniref:Uncharacterized protein n=1 Tax=Eubacterium ventriosum ATCC 27560 TaxID=411463 RepID=A5Z449_9FIRM|nr:hypothetical protein EUBVEN_00454 [Eubacterium ventriosum ATCC 27560]
MCFCIFISYRGPVTLGVFIAFLSAPLFGFIFKCIIPLVYALPFSHLCRINPQGFRNFCILH